jgi:hypothetical protein
MPDIAFAGIKPFYLVAVDVESQDSEANLPETQKNGQANVAQTNDAHGIVSSGDAIF